MHYRWLNPLVYYPVIYLDILFFACSSYFYFSFMTKIILMSRSLVDRFLPWIPGFVPGRACEIYGERRDIKKIIY